MNDAIDDIRKRPGIKQRDFKPCARCKKHVTQTGGLTFYRLKVEVMVLDVGAIRQQVGLGMMLGGGGAGAALAAVMGPDADLAKLFVGPFDVFLCENCAMDVECIPQLVENLDKDASDGKENG